MTEIRGAPAYGHDQIIVRQNRAAVVDLDGSLAAIDASHGPEHHRRPRRVAEQRTDRTGDFRGVETSGGDLVKQWLEKVMIAAVEHGNLHVAAFLQFPGGAQPGEPGSDDDHTPRACC